MTVLIREASLQDVPGLEAIVNQHWKANIDHRKEVKNAEAVLLVAEGDSVFRKSRHQILGTALMWVTKWNKTGYLVELAVEKKNQRKGIALKLVKNLAKRASDLGLRAIIVETQPDNKAGMDFYLHSGFRLCGYNDRYYTNNPTSSHEIALFFSLEL